ncbi:MAG: hypothetical protein HYT28_01000 [Parcubacteria group bacterium]|nr:hypothetical protein [Parcubacteria group bacterium]
MKTKKESMIAVAFCSLLILFWFLAPNAVALVHTPMMHDAHGHSNHLSPQKSPPKSDVVPAQGDMFDAAKALADLDKKYLAAQNEEEKDLLRQKIARTALVSGRSGKILSQKDGRVVNGRVGHADDPNYWIINARSDGHQVTCAIISRDGREKSEFSFFLH